MSSQCALSITEESDTIHAYAAATQCLFLPVISRYIPPSPARIPHYQSRAFRALPVAAESQQKSNLIVSVGADGQQNGWQNGLVVSGCVTMMMATVASDIFPYLHSLSIGTGHRRHWKGSPAATKLLDRSLLQLRPSSSSSLSSSLIVLFHVHCCVYVWCFRSCMFLLAVVPYLFRSF